MMTSWGFALGEDAEAGDFAVGWFDDRLLFGLMGADRDGPIMLVLKDRAPDDDRTVPYLLDARHLTRPAKKVHGQIIVEPVEPFSAYGTEAQQGMLTVNRAGALCVLARWPGKGAASISLQAVDLQTGAPAHAADGWGMPDWRIMATVPGRSDVIEVCRFTG